jgi:CDP-diacylglycerol--glycerol-3-phosphate 3-phosphatidyltransferase
MIAELKRFGQRGQEIYMDLIEPLSKALARAHIHPHVLTASGFALGLVAANFFRVDRFFLAGIFIILAGTCDILDGRLARDTGTGSAYGALFDSTVDRYTEVVVFLGLAWYYLARSQTTVLVILLAVAGSMMVSYTRARAEGLGLECRVGIMQRQHRITLLAAGAMLAAIPGTKHVAMLVSIWIIAILANVTAVQRVVYIRGQLRRKIHENLTAPSPKKETIK